jgi:glucosyl-3-phosphoglycerate phosphatase
MTSSPSEHTLALPEQRTRPRLVLARHGRSTWNAERRFQGQSDPPLDAVGRDQAHCLAEALLPMGPALVMTSDLRRAVSSAIPFALAGVRLVVHPGLREVGLGAWEGLDESTAQARFPGEYTAWQSGQAGRRGGGETADEAGRRAIAAIELGLRRQPGLLVVISHGLVLQAAMALLVQGGRIRVAGPVPHLTNGAFVTFTDDGQLGVWPDPRADTQLSNVEP